MILRHAILSIAFVLLYLALNQPPVILISQLGSVAWYPATGLVLAVLLGISPGYAVLVCLADALAGALIYHQPLLTFGETVGSLGVAACYGTAACILRGPLQIDLGLRRRQDVVRYVFVTMSTAMVATVTGVSCLAADKSIAWSEFWSASWSWFAGDGIGLLGVAPFLLVHVCPWVRKQLAPKTVEANLDGDRTRNEAIRVDPAVLGSLASLRLRETLRDQSIRDPLTGLFNRRFMEESLEREMQRAVRKNHPVAVLFVDLDHFKRFNDTFGHDAGDLVLRSMADLFRKLFRLDDVICRYGGEEFGIILPESSAENAALRANGLREETKKLEIRYKNHALGRITLSIGVASFPEQGQTSEELLKAADQCLYKSKSGGTTRQGDRSYSSERRSRHG